MTPNKWPLREITLKVLDLPGLTAFYESFGLRVLERSKRSAVLAAGEMSLILKQLPSGRQRPPRTAGLYHFALLLPTRQSLGAFLRAAYLNAWQFAGSADHLVSESLYFYDPEGNGIEVYADRPAESWDWSDGTVKMATWALDLDELTQLSGPEWNGFPPGTRLGHMHLTVSDLDRSQEFYESLGMKLTLDWGTFRFMAWDDYHHHVAINLVEGRKALPVTPDINGLEAFSIERDSVHGKIVDPNGIALKQHGVVRKAS
jgi:catechol 2,3-dioxygenase